MKPFLKWAGSKYKIINTIKELLPPGKRLIEPFAGSGAVFLNTSYPNYLVADANADLINVFTHIQRDGIDFIDIVRALFTQKTNQETVFYDLREEFNTTKDQRRKACLFIYLNRHCFNGLCRYNLKGQFNVPFGHYSKPSIPEKEMLNFFEKSMYAEFKTLDFRETMQIAELGDVIYCDPPYVPLNTSKTFTSYTQAGFSLQDQQILADMAINLVNKGVCVLISNHDTVLTRMMYASAEIHAFSVQRFIASHAENRHKAPELLAVFS